MQQQGRMALDSQLANQKAMEAAYGRGLKGSQLLAGLDKSEQALDLQRLKALSDVGGQRQALMQRAYDQQYEDFLAQREYPYQQLEDTVPYYKVCQHNQVFQKEGLDKQLILRHNY